MKRDYRVYLRDILAAFRNAREFVEGCSYPQFIADRKTISAVLRELEIAGEATKHLPARTTLSPLCQKKGREFNAHSPFVLSFLRRQESII